MNTDTMLSNDAVVELKKLLSTLGSFECNTDMYFACINKVLNSKTAAESSV